MLHHVPPSLSRRLAACSLCRSSAAVSAGCSRAAPSDHGATTVARRHVHERPFQELPEDLSQGEAYARARDALLQLNVMHRLGIEPDALMYTALIATMGRAGLEWQAYKLFSRMIEQDVKPLPETYVALRDATSKHRVELREQIQTKIEEAVDVFPEELAGAERERQREEDRRCVAKFKEYMRGALPATRAETPTAAAPAVADASKPSESAKTTSDELPSTPAATMHIRNPSDAWHAAQMATEHRSHAQGLAQGESAADLRAALERLDEEELRIYLAAQRQLRHGTKAQLIDRVLQRVGANAIRAMLDRRAHYFRSVEQILATDLRQLNASGSGVAPQGTSATAAGEGPGAGVERDRTLTTSEQDAARPDVLHAPWGILRRPMRRRPEPPAPRNAERLERIRLSEPELMLLRQKAETNELDELPESLLRRYAYQFQLRWRRSKGAASLLEAVQWHVITYFPSAVQLSAENSEKGWAASAAPTPAIRLEKEEEGMRQTLENFEAFRIIAQRTSNLQVVDSKEINRHLQHVRRETVRQERKMEHTLRRERHVMEATGLAASAKTFTPLPMEDEGDMQVLGITADATSVAGGSATTGMTPAEDVPTSLITSGVADNGGAEAGAEDDATVSELPPWALFEEEDEFNLSTGHFGDPDTGRFQELSDSKVRLLPSRSAQAKWSVDRQLLPTSLKDIVHEAELGQQQRHEAIEREYERRLQYTKYRKWDLLIAKAQSKRSMDRARKAEAGATQPLPAKRRLSQLLRKGRDRERVSEETRARYSKGL
ncbi:hypothetical protein ABL78_5625 [Leptomonas seymouri]|uniref:Uncharacterized protein n=1 Tax=Leptomonas seymouri TaxID=5684 RepID=A0A0N1IJP3_LEPSE|nr:hypothetical protein ABL78_5625 [Leptomonas seymouri]|eukprot:KPI85313.1 hypothetical protein ABL78_5625 [Leptomonas seymouri]